MADNISRIEQDRALFEKTSRDHLAETIANANPNLVVGVIAKALELQIVTEEIARNNGIDITEDMIAEYSYSNQEYINEQLERSLSSFICSIVSQEG